MIRITYISAIDGKASMRTYKTHAKAVSDWNLIVSGGGFTHCATMTSGGKIMRAYASGAFTRAQSPSTWATQ